MRYKDYKHSDLLLLTHLRKNARSTLTNLSKKTRIPVSTVFDKIRLFESLYVTKYTSLIDFTKFGFFARAHVIFRVSKKHIERVREFLLDHPNVNSLYKINNGYDFQVELVFKHIQELENFLDGMNRKFTIKQSIIYYLLDELRREAFLTTPNSIELVMPS
ncbi:Lrp/AsnC family transcriptional regulator [Candidatus Woesearchaeota archaeon]|jgi:DNA-binding Lrp family transcriptional regulator|nr:Lrp/AsnC family transcriptional regulator [Candidatus Woesearchaeota archaeon]MBT5272311.1 Lrp/AsnC family transcriptional regulator [Candidatus Woesearchaeota archaeon]MBT6040640.1 Lrp/AsnC family transcriptional regulator [Candidatus Woesearchaeota archaeon]MBT6336583.1 Lrp/AsnC family transcriptional regulator [Candidatus Woesearchaeota archaeon]MBT7927473.1 Lrp/AsnC family transcriptional regulator [Candidatus Woesearchaeota archaeon]